MINQNNFGLLLFSNLHFYQKNIFIWYTLYAFLMIEVNTLLENLQNDDSLKDYPSFLNSLKIYNYINKYPKGNDFSTIESNLLFLASIIAMETLIVNKHETKIEMFSVRLAWLLGTNASQRDKIQDQLGTLYSLRNNIVHEFTPPINSIEFKRNFNDDFKIASDIAKKYLCLSLLRVIKAEKEFLSKEEITSKLSNKLEGKKIDLEFSFHDEIISEKISSLTGRNSSPKNERDIYNELPNKKEIYILGLNTYGGLVEPTHKTIANYPYLYNHDYRIIPDKKTIARLKNKINLVCNQIIKSKYKTIKIVSKSYLPFLFFIGYKFRNQNFIIKMNFQDIEKELITHKNLDADFDSFWISDFKNYNSDSDNLIIIINTSTNLFESFIVSNECNRLKNDYLIIYTLRPENESNDSKKTISSFEYLEKATFSLYKEITNFSGVNNKKIHLFFRGPSCMEILLGRYFSNLKNTIFLYELGKINSDNSYQEFFCFFSLKKGNY